MTYQCAACQGATKNWNGDDRRCGFAHDAFSSDNWMCATLAFLRELVEDEDHPAPQGVGYQQVDGQQYATVRVDQVDLHGESIGLALWMAWYKNRGGTEALWLLEPDLPPRAPTESEIRAVLEHYGKL